MATRQYLDVNQPTPSYVNETAGAKQFKLDGNVYIDSSSAPLTATGTIAVTEGADVLAAFGQVKVSGPVSVTEGLDVLAAVGKVQISGTIAATEGADVLAATGAVQVSGTIAATEGDDNCAASGSVIGGQTQDGGSKKRASKRARDLLEYRLAIAETDHETKILAKVKKPPRRRKGAIEDDEDEVLELLLLS